MVAVLALAVAVLSGREAARRTAGGAPSLEVLSSGLEQIAGFVGDLLYLRIDDYHHIWMYQGHEWTEATDYLPMVWLVSRLKPEYARNYVNGGYHLAVNLGRVEEGVRFMRRGLRMCPTNLDLVWEYAVVLWKTAYGSPRERERALWRYLRMVRARGGDPDEPWNEYNSLMVLRRLFEADTDRAHHDRIADIYGRFHRNRARSLRLREGRRP
jgi:hypothetical protein